jgi:histone acetyltransferase 1
MSGRADM